MPLIDEPLLTFEYAQGSFYPAPGSGYIHGATGEERAGLPTPWLDELRRQGTRIFSVVDESRDAFDVEDSGRRTHVSLRSAQEVQRFVASLPGAVYLDITALTHPTWARILAALVVDRDEHYVVYSEPLRYVRHANPAHGIIYDLSERIEGIAPLPGFARFAGPVSDEGNVVALLGFEGARLGYLIERLQVSLTNVVPVVGVPGFILGHPFESLAGNRDVLTSDYVHGRTRYAKANCPFDAFHQIHSAFEDGAWEYGRVAPIGTKPHGVGAVLYALSHPKEVELVYDHPVRSAKRSQGKGRVCVYSTGAFCRSDLFLASNPGADS
ncbi:hypothetical protein [Cellulomonas sp. NPDC058312]|uniref:hypothetical protein n=1 Tax=Cellulomonas sp. NPDC058312 TaxID=3346441 RepID=UPI0036F054BE